MPPTSSSTALGAGIGHRSRRKPAQIERPPLVPLLSVEFRRINALPPYAFAQIDALKMQFRRAGEDVIDLAFGNPDIPSPTIAVEKLAEAVRNPRNHRYSTSKGIPKLRMAVADLYRAHVRRGARLRDRGVLDDRRQRGLLAPHAHARRAGRHRARAEPVVPDPHLGPDPRRRRGALRAHGSRARLLRQPAHRVRRGVAPPARDRHVVPAQPHHRVRRLRVHGAARRVRA